MISRAVLFAAGALAVSMANGQSFSFQIFENAAGVDVTGLDLRVDLIENGGFVDMVVSNHSTIGGVVTRLYVEDCAALALGGVEILPGGVGGAWSAGNLNHQPPGSLAAFSGDWGGTLVNLGADPSPVANGIGAGEWLTVRFDLGSSDFQSVVDAFAAQELRLVGHVQALGPESVWGVTVPAPASAALVLGGLLIAARRRR